MPSFQAVVATEPDLACLKPRKSEPVVIPNSWLQFTSPIELDMGCHRGAFVVGMATLYPDRRFLGVEKQLNRVDRSNTKIRRLGLKNACVVRGDGLSEIGAILGERSISMIHVSFPDPWPKRRHHVRRLVDAAFLIQSAKLLIPGGQVRLMTDDAAYFSAMCEAASDPAVELREIPWVDDREVVSTEFESKFAAKGLSPYRMALAL